jgi:site-specific DNA-methyltransferase (adenine-specific)
MGALYFGDNLDILRSEIKSESVDLVYLDPPFNSKRDYNLLFKTPKGHESDAQIKAFDDTWHWGAQAEREFDELLHQPNTDVSEMIQAMRHFLKESDVMAYLAMMTNRLLELHRVLKPSGSLYLHCDPTASHYLKIILDNIFGSNNFRNELIWSYRKWAVAEKCFSKNHDVILFYVKDSNSSKFNVLLQQRAASTLKRFGNKKIVSAIDSSGRRVPSQTLDQESEGVKMPDVWDIPIIAPSSKERLGYPTQKPLALLERIIQASSNKGDVVLDPFCGCGTAVHAAQKLERDWIGIDITHLAISLIEKRMKDAFPNITFQVHGTPKDLDGAKELASRDKYQFQWWACSLVNAQPYQGKKKGSDGGIDGLIFFQDDETGAKKIIVSVKGGEHVSVTMVKDLIATVEREKAAIGLFVTLAVPTKPMVTEAVSAGFYKSPKGDVPKIQILTIEDLLSGKAKPQYFDMSSGVYNFKKAKVERQKAEQKQLL